MKVSELWAVVSAVASIVLLCLGAYYGTIKAEYAHGAYLLLLALGASSGGSKK